MIRSVVVCTFIVAAPRSVEACTPACPTWLVAPANGVSLPANAPAIAFRFSGPESTIQLQSGGADVPFTKSGDVLRLGAALSAGSTLVLTTRVNSCGFMNEGAVTTSIPIAPAAPQPTRLGSLTVDSYRRADVAIPGGEQCFTYEPGAWARLRLSLDPSVGPYRSVMGITTYVDGKRWSSTWYGSDDALEIFASCGSTPRGVTPGKHRVEIEGEIAGGAVLPRLPIDVDLECSDENSGCSLRPASTGGSFVGLGLLIGLARIFGSRRNR